MRPAQQHNRRQFGLLVLLALVLGCLALILVLVWDDSPAPSPKPTPRPPTPTPPPISSFFQEELVLPEGEDPYDTDDVKVVVYETAMDLYRKRRIEEPRHFHAIDACGLWMITG